MSCRRPWSQVTWRLLANSASLLKFWQDFRVGKWSRRVTFHTTQQTVKWRTTVIQTSSRVPITGRVPYLTQSQPPSTFSLFSPPSFPLRLSPKFQIFLPLFHFDSHQHPGCWRLTKFEQGVFPSKNWEEFWCSQDNISPQTQKANIWLPKRKRSGTDTLGVWTQQIHTTIYKTVRARTHCRAQELYSISCNSL